MCGGLSKASKAHTQYTHKYVCKTRTHTLKKSMKEMCQPSVSALEAITMLAEAPIKVPLPPKQAPKASALCRYKHV